jgi:4-amino-4-deoxy-L-arabinose transferase-like glycosyltransferase
LVERGELRLSDWTATNLIAQLFWGALFCLPAGFSFTALRLSTLTLGLIGVLATYGLLREARAPAPLAILGSLVLAFSPIYFSLSFTFMSDVPFVATATVASWLLLRGLRRASSIELIGGLTLVAVAVLIRPVGLALPFAFAFAYILKYGPQIRRLLESILLVGAGLALQIGFERWLRWSDRLPVMFGNQVHQLQSQLHLPWSLILSEAITITSYSFIYAGVFLFAFLIATHRIPRRMPVIVTGIVAATTSAMAMWGELMPLHGNILHKGGLGCCVDRVSQAPSYFWMLVTFIGVFGSILLITESLRSLICILPSRQKSGEERYVLAFALLAIIIGFAPLPFVGLGWNGFYDRYLMIFLPFVMLMFVAASCTSTFTFRGRSITLFVSTATLIGTAAFSVAATHDYLAASRVRWAALQHLLAEGISPERIDGGFEFGGLYLYNIPYAHHEGECCYWKVNDDYIVSGFELKGYATLATYDIEHWLPWGRGKMIVQRRIDA